MFQMDRRGYIREGYHADLVLVDPQRSLDGGQEQPAVQMRLVAFRRTTLRFAKVIRTWVNGDCVFADGRVDTYGAW